MRHNTWYLWTDPSTTLTYTLNTDPLTGGSATGYDITGVNVFAGWQDPVSALQSQNWTLRVATLANPTFTDVQAVDYLADPADARVQDGIAYGFDRDDCLGRDGRAVLLSKNRSQSSGIVFRDIDVVGAATVPEPGTIAMLGIAALLGLVAVRRRRA